MLIVVYNEFLVEFIGSICCMVGCDWFGIGKYKLN